MYGKHSQTALTAWLATALAAAAATSVPEGLTLDIARVKQGEWWRLASGHLVHLTWQHYRYDLLALGLSLCLCSRLTDRFPAIAVAALFSACAVSATLMVVYPVDIYGGVSGITAGLLSFAALRLIAHAPLSGTVLFAGMLLKIWLERQGLSASGVAPVWQAHCAGAAAGAVVATFRWILFGQAVARRS